MIKSLPVQKPFGFGQSGQRGQSQDNSQMAFQTLVQSGMPEEKAALLAFSPQGLSSMFAQQLDPQEIKGMLNRPPQQSEEQQQMSQLTQFLKGGSMPQTPEFDYGKAAERSMDRPFGMGHPGPDVAAFKQRQTKPPLDSYEKLAGRVPLLDKAIKRSVFKAPKTTVGRFFRQKSLKKASFEAKKLLKTGKVDSENLAQKLVQKGWPMEDAVLMAAPYMTESIQQYIFERSGQNVKKAKRMQKLFGF